MSQFELYPRDWLPVGFKYPKMLQEFAATGVYPVITPWWFVDANTKAGKLIASVAPGFGRNLVPFSKVDDGRDDVACFDGGDTSGDPKVLMLVLDDSGRQYGYANFDAWLEAALMDARKYT